MIFEYIEKLIKLFIASSAIIFFTIIVLLFASIVFSSYIIIKEFLKFLQFNPLTFHNFVSSMATLIEFALFNIVLFMLANGIYVRIIKPIVAIKGKKEFSLQEMFKDFVAYLSHPFLMIVASILIVSIFETIIELYSAIRLKLRLEEIDFNTYFYFNIVLIFFIFIAIITISVLMRVEKSFIHSENDKPK